MATTAGGLSHTILTCGQALSCWSNKVFGDIPKELEICRKELDGLEALVQTLDVV